MITNITRQSGVIPYRLIGDDLHILMITSRRTKRWTVPKGHIEPGMNPMTSAAKEAIEEAGILGELSPMVAGTMYLNKRGQNYAVVLFPMLVSELLEHWPEMYQRRRKWFNLNKAVKVTGYPQLHAPLTKLPELVALELQCQEQFQVA